MHVIGFKIWYGDGTVWWRGPSRDDGPWEAAPDDGVVDVLIYFDEASKGGIRYREVQSGYDTYLSDGDQLFGGNNDDLETNRRRYPCCTFKRGKWFAHEVWGPIHERATADMEI